MWVLIVVGYAGDVLKHLYMSDQLALTEVEIVRRVPHVWNVVIDTPDQMVAIHRTNGDIYIYKKEN